LLLFKYVTEEGCQCNIANINDKNILPVKYKPTADKLPHGRHVSTGDGTSRGEGCDWFYHLWLGSNDDFRWGHFSNRTLENKLQPINKYDNHFTNISYDQQQMCKTAKCARKFLRYSEFIAINLGGRHC